MPPVSRIQRCATTLLWILLVPTVSVAMTLRPTTRVAILAYVLAFAPCTTCSQSSQQTTIGPENGWLVIQGGGALTPEVKERFVALAGGADAAFVLIPTAQGDAEIDSAKLRQSFSKRFGVKLVTVLHTRDRVRANSTGFVEPLRQASGVWIEGGRQWRLADAYLGTAVESEIKALLARGGIVGGGSAGATIQGSFLVRGAPGTRRNPDGDNSILMSPGHETGFALLANSAIDQHVNTRNREQDLDRVVSAHRNLLGIGIDEAAAIVVHGDSFFVVGGEVAIHDGENHQGARYYFLSSGQGFDLRSRSTLSDLDNSGYPLTLRVLTAARTRTESGVKTSGSGVLESKDGSPHKPTAVKIECDVSLYSLGNNLYLARPDGDHQLKIQTRAVDSDQLTDFACKY